MGEIPFETVDAIVHDKSNHVDSILVAPGGAQHRAVRRFCSGVIPQSEGIRLWFPSPHRPARDPDDSRSELHGNRGHLSGAHLGGRLEPASPMVAKSPHHQLAMPRRAEQTPARRIVTSHVGWLHREPFEPVPGRGMRPDDPVLASRQVTAEHVMAVPAGPDAGEGGHRRDTPRRIMTKAAIPAVAQRDCASRPPLAPGGPPLSDAPSVVHRAHETGRCMTCSSVDLAHRRCGLAWRPCASRLLPPAHR